MKLGCNKTFWKVFVALELLTLSIPAFAIGMTIATALVTAGYLSAGTAMYVAAFAINMVASAIITKAFFTPNQPGIGLSGSSPNPGNRVQLPPNTANKLPVVYGTAYVGGTIIDLSITKNDQTLYYVFALTEVTNNGQDTISFGNIYWGGRRCVFDDTDPTKVVSLIDESTGITETAVSGKLFMYLYRNGSGSGVNTTSSAIQIMQNANLEYQWNNTKLMTNCAFAIVKLIYNPDAGTTSLQQTKFQITNSRTKPGDCILDYLKSTTYGAGISTAQINTASLTELNTYSDEQIVYEGYDGINYPITRFRFDGVVDTSRTVMENLQEMSTCCDCLIKYNEITSQWGVIVQKPTYTVSMALDNSNVIGGISISPFDTASTYNIIECKFPDSRDQDNFSTATFDLSQIAPALLYPNEPVNKQSLSLPFVSSNIRAQYLANRLLKASREDLQINCQINFQGLQLEAGDIVSMTNANYGWVDKLFRINKVTEKFGDDGSITATLQLSAFNPAVYDDTIVKEFDPLPNTGLYNPLTFGTVPAPVVTAEYPFEVNPLFLIQITSSSAGIIQYAEVYYSAFSNPTTAQRIFAGTTAIQSDGTPYNPNTILPLVSLSDIPYGNWYFFTRMVNSFGASQFSPASTLFKWRPRTFQYVNKYLDVAYADNITGTSNFSFNPTNRLYYGLRNVTSSQLSTDPTLYTWYLADPNFETTQFLCYSNRTGRKFSFDTGLAGWVGNNAAFVPTNTNQFDPSIWSALPVGVNTIDLDVRTGQLTQLGYTSNGNASGELTVENNTDGAIRVSLKPIQDFSGGTYTGSAASITIDNYGRVVGFESPDNFYFTKTSFTATSGQTVFSVTRNANYIVGQCLVFSNGLLLDTSEYTDAAGSVTLSVGAAAGVVITIISFRSTSSVSVTTTGASGTGSIATLTFASRPKVPFQVGQSITVTGVTPAGYNGTYTVTACTTTSVSYSNTTTGAQTVAGSVSYTNNTYKSFSRNTADITNTSSYTVSGFDLLSGYEFLFINGVALNEIDYNIVGQTITDFPASATGKLTVIQWTPDNLGQPNGFATNIIQIAIIGQVTYPFSYDQNAFDFYDNGVLLLQTTDYSTATGTYTLTNTPTTNDTFIQQTFARAGAA